MSTGSAASAGKRLLIIEDDIRLGSIMYEVLSTDWDVEFVTTAESGLELLATRCMDVLIIDRGLPGISGEECIRELRRQRVQTPILILTALGQLRDRVAGLDAGANDYLVKPFEFDELNARLRALTRRFDGKDTGRQIGNWVFYEADSMIESPYTGRILLTVTETAVLAVLAAHPGRTFSREQLLAHACVQGESTATVDTYVHYLRRKTDRDLIQTVRGRGYRINSLD